MKPEISEQIDGILLNWQGQKVKIKVSRINLHKDGRVTGEMVITTDAQGYSPMLMPATQLNFSAEQTRTRLIKNLAEKYQAFDWATIIDELAHYVQKSAREGEPVKELWTHDEVEPPQYLLEPVMFKGIPNVIYGEKGVSKSTLALAFYTCLILPWHDNPLNLIVPDKPVKSLILDWETEGDIVQYYAKRIQTGMSLPTFPVYYRRCALTLADDLEQIQGHMNSVNAEAVIIDSLGAAAGGELKSAEIALNFFSALRKLKTSSLIIAQTSKDEDSKKKRIFGSVYFEYYSRNIWELCKPEPVSDDEYDIALFHRSSNLSRPHRPMGFHLHFNESGLDISRTEVDLREFRTRISTQTKILESLKEGKMRAGELADKVGAEESTVRVILTKLKKKEKVVNVDGLWGLYAQPELY